jgi:hypothetical protein
MIEYGKGIAGSNEWREYRLLSWLGFVLPNIRPDETGFFDKLLIKRLIDSIASCHLVDDVCRVKRHHHIQKIEPISSTARPGQKIN